MRISTIATSGPQLLHLLEQFARIRRLPHDLEPGLGQQPRHALANQHGVVGEHYAHGIAASTCVPWPRALSTLSDPPSAWTRSARPRKPGAMVGVGPSNPVVSHAHDHNKPVSRVRRDVADEACACLVMLANASATT